MTENILIFGSGSKVGEALTKLLLESNYSVTSIGRTNINTSSEIEFIEHDIHDWNTALPILTKQYKSIIYLPGTIEIKPFLSITMDDFQRDMKINFLSAVRVTQNYLELLEGQNNPSLTFISSVAVGTGLPYHASIASAKGAVENYVLSLAAEFAPKIRVNAVSPSLTDTPLANKLIDTPEKKATLAQKHPMQRIGIPEDIANAIYFLISDNSSWITGQVLGVDGGFSSLRKS